MFGNRIPVSHILPVGYRSGVLPETRKVDVRLPEKGDSKSHGAGPAHPIITMMKWIRTSKLSLNNSLTHILPVGCRSGVLPHHDVRRSCRSDRRQFFSTLSSKPQATSPEPYAIRPNSPTPQNPRTPSTKPELKNPNPKPSAPIPAPKSKTPGPKPQHSNLKFTISIHKIQDPTPKTQTPKI